MIEDVKELRIKAQLHVLADWEPLREVEVVPHEIGAAQRIASEISELTVLRSIPAVARPRARIERDQRRRMDTEISPDRNGDRQG